MIFTPLIAIDGPAASGKGTLARRVAAALGYGYMDTGLLYRAVGLAAQKDQTPEGAALALAQDFTPALLDNPYLRSDEAGQAASHVAAIPPVREALIDLQRRFASNPGQGFKGAVLDGRDIGTVICPQAPVKLFITAPVETRAERRLKELQSRGIEATYEAVLRDMRARDARDAERETAPMRPADDALVMDTQGLDADAVFAAAMKIISQKLGL
ncbi:MAG: cytidylate kinase [Alphaproteobacteria bacterium]|nr:cytidylate kinase [Alphaproteobacteria bacterium]